MAKGVLHSGENSNKGDTVFFGVRFLSCTLLENQDPVMKSGNRDDRQEKNTTSRVRSAK